MNDPNHSVNSNDKTSSPLNKDGDRLLGLATWYPLEKPISLMIFIFDRWLISICIVSLADTTQSFTAKISQLNCPLKYFTQPSRWHLWEWISESIDFSNSVFHGPAFLTTVANMNITISMSLFGTNLFVFGRSTEKASGPLMFRSVSLNSQVELSSHVQTTTFAELALRNSQDKSRQNWSLASKERYFAGTQRQDEHRCPGERMFLEP